MANEFVSLDRVLERVNTILEGSDIAPELFFGAVRQVLLNLDFYPPARSQGVKFEFATDKSRRWFWWMVSKGLMKVPYQRTNTLRKATELIPLKVEPKRFVIAVHVDLTKARYANYVIGNRQVPGHKTTGWNQLYTSVNDATPGLVKQIAPLYTAELRGYLRAGF